MPMYQMLILIRISIVTPHDATADTNQTVVGLLLILASCVAGTLMLMVVPLHVLNVDPIPNPAHLITSGVINVIMF